MSAAAARDLHYDDIAIGQSVAFGHYEVGEAERVDFARAFDPQPFHLSEEGAKDSIPGRLFASGFHTCAMMMNMLATDLLAGAAALGSPGIDEVKFLRPVFPGDSLSARATCLEKRLLQSRPGVGVCRFQIQMIKGAGEVVMTWNTNIFFRQRVTVRGGAAAP